MGIKELKFASRQVDLLVDYVRERPEITDILITGGDPLTMSAKVLGSYIRPIVEARIPHLQNIRIGTKALSFWPYQFTSDSDAFVQKGGLHLAEYDPDAIWFNELMPAFGKEKFFFEADKAPEIAPH